MASSSLSHFTAQWSGVSSSCAPHHRVGSSGLVLEDSTWYGKLVLKRNTCEVPCSTPGLTRKRAGSRQEAANGVVAGAAGMWWGLPYVALPLATPCSPEPLDWCFIQNTTPHWPAVVRAVLCKLSLAVLCYAMQAVAGVGAGLTQEGKAIGCSAAHHWEHLSPPGYFRFNT
jgi:hypothetical protein